MLFPQKTINCKRRLISLENPIVMGILNITPDSFYDGGTNTDISKVLNKAEQMLLEGATILDIGGMSSRPGADIISVKEELNRVIPVITAIIKHFPDSILSIDTVQSLVAKAAIEAGASIVNDISAGKIDPEMYTTVAQLGVPYILMHMQGQPKNMQEEPTYEEVQLNVLDFLIEELGKLRTLGGKDVVIDPGFGFGKSIAHNYQLLKEMHTLQQGASILRVHDVREAMETIRLFQYVEV